MRVVATGLKTLRPFSPSWFFLCAVALLFTFGLGGGTPNSSTWLIVKVLLLGVLLTGPLVVLASHAWDWLTRTK